MRSTFAEALKYERLEIGQLRSTTGQAQPRQGKCLQKIIKHGCIVVFNLIVGDQKQYNKTSWAKVDSHACNHALTVTRANSARSFTHLETIEHTSIKKEQAEQ